jgi:hypothetical protein
MVIKKEATNLSSMNVNCTYKPVNGLENLDTNVVRPDEYLITDTGVNRGRPELGNTQVVSQPISPIGIANKHNDKKYKDTLKPLDVQGLPKRIKTYNINKKTVVNNKTDSSPKGSVGQPNEIVVISTLDIKDSSKDNKDTTLRTTGTKKYYNCTKLIKIDLDKPKDTFDRSRSLKPTNARKKYNYLIPVVKTNLYDDDNVSPQTSFKSETYTSETDRENRIRKLSEVRNEKKYSRQESSESKTLSENENFSKINDKLNSIKFTFCHKDKKELSEGDGIASPSDFKEKLKSLNKIRSKKKL